MWQLEAAGVCEGNWTLKEKKKYNMWHYGETLRRWKDNQSGMLSLLTEST
jgi:hypothetical protein